MAARRGGDRRVGRHSHRLGCVDGFRQSLFRLHQRRRDLLRDGPQPGERLRPRVPPRGSGTSLARVSGRSGRALSEARHRQRRVAIGVVSLHHGNRAAGRGYLTPLLRQVLHLPAVRGAVRSRVRHQRISGAARRADDPVLFVRLRLSRGAQSPGRGADLRVRVSVRLGRTHLHGADHAGLLQSGADAHRLLLLVLQGNDYRGGSPGRARCLQAVVARSTLGRRCRDAARHRDLLETDQRVADCPATRIGGVTRAVVAGTDHRRRLRLDGRRAVHAEHRDHRGVELSGWRSTHVLQRDQRISRCPRRIPVSGRPAPLRQHRPRHDNQSRAARSAGQPGRRPRRVSLQPRRISCSAGTRALPSTISPA